jgi:hypothetical protein
VNGIVRFILLAFLFTGCATSNSSSTPGFAGHTPKPLQGGNYDQREQIDDDPLDYRNGNFDPTFDPNDPDPDIFY